MCSLLFKPINKEVKEINIYTYIFAENINFLMCLNIEETKIYSRQKLFDN